MKKTITTAIFIFMISIGITGTSFAGDTYTTGFGIVNGNIEYNTSACSTEYPLHVTFSNRTVRTVGSVSFALSARYQGRSSNLINSGHWVKDGYRGGWHSDRIIDRFDEVGMCYRLPTLSEITNPEQLVWEIEITHVGWK